MKNSQYFLNNQKKLKKKYEFVFVKISILLLK